MVSKHMEHSWRVGMTFCGRTLVRAGVRDLAVVASGNGLTLASGIRSRDRTGSRKS